MSPTSAWMNGKLIHSSQAVLPFWDLGVVAGASISEMARTFQYQPFRLAEHLDRFAASCESLRFPLRHSREELHAAVSRVVELNSPPGAADRPTKSSGDLGIVVFCTAGANATYLSAGTDIGADWSDEGQTVIHTFPLPFALWQTAMAAGLRLRIPLQRQLPENSFPVSHKTRNRLHWWLADRAVASVDPSSKALLLDEQGFLTETSTSCFYAVIEGCIVTPDYSVLNSMSRQVVQELANECAIPLVRRNLHPDELALASEAFVSSTPSCLLPVQSVDDLSIGEGASRPVFERLLRAWSDRVDVDIRRQILGEADRH
ncbi:MAG: aminotransferase class IV family protein [Planctomycetaceae bacterium]|nr:aminotransferase class IV family protein [Planctomycetaceae bacterium]